MDELSAGSGRGVEGSKASLEHVVQKTWIKRDTMAKPPPLGKLHERLAKPAACWMQTPQPLVDIGSEHVRNVGTERMVQEAQMAVAAVRNMKIACRSSTAVAAARRGIVAVGRHQDTEGKHRSRSSR